MAGRRARANGITPNDPTDRYGRLTVPGGTTIFTERRLRRLAQARGKFNHRQKNGVRDPFTFFHLVHALADIRPWSDFTAGDMTEHLNRTATEFCWDSVTVGRILSELAETFEEVYGPEARPLISGRTYNGRRYEVTDYQAARAALANLLDDLVRLGDSVQEEEREGITRARIDSPLNACPSVMDLLAGAAEDLTA